MSAGRIAGPIISRSGLRNEFAAGNEPVSHDDVKRMEADCIGLLKEGGLE